MDPEFVINLFDSCWFNYEILKGGSQYLREIKNKQSSDEPKFSSLRSILVRSQSEDMGSSFNYGSFSPNSVLFTPQLKSIPSAKSVSTSTQDQEKQQVHKPETKEQVIADVIDNDEVIIFQERKKKNYKNRRHHGMSKSLSELEFEELKGFMDLGFVFSEQDQKDSDLVEIIPGLQRLGKEREKECGDDNDNDDYKDKDDDKKSSCASSTRRPYLSEAWQDLDTKLSNKKQQKQPPMMMNWEIPAVNSEVDMKDNLKLWAHTVASIVK